MYQELQRTCTGIVLPIEPLFGDFLVGRHVLCKVPFFKEAMMATPRTLSIK